MIIVIRLQESSVALLKVIDYIVAGDTKVSEYSNLHSFIRNNKTMWVAGVMEFRKACNGKSTNRNRFVCFKRCNQMTLHTETLLLHGFVGNINRHLIFFRKPLNALHMIAVFVGNKDGLHLFQREIKPLHPYF